MTPPAGRAIMGGVRMLPLSRQKPRASHLSDPPRQLSVLFSLRIVFGSVLAQVGWGVLGFGSIFLWTFVAQADWAFITMRGPLATSSGQVTAVANTHASENDQEIYRIDYTFTASGGRTLPGHSYSRGSHLKPDAAVTIEYLRENPARSRIQGLRTGMFGPLVLLVGIVPLGGAIVAIISLRSGLRGRRLLCDGLLTTGKLVSRDATNTQVNDQVVYKHTFDFVANDGRTYQVVGWTSTTLLTDEAEEVLVYGSADPARAVLLSRLPGDPHIDPTGQFVVRSPASALLILILPALAIVGNLTALTLILSGH